MQPSLSPAQPTAWLCPVPGVSRGDGGEARSRPPTSTGSGSCHPAEACPPLSTGMSGPRPVVLSGPSGAGKSTLLKRLLQEHGSVFGFSVSREAPGQGEGPARVSGVLGWGRGQASADLPWRPSHPWVTGAGPRGGTCGLWVSRLSHGCLFLDTTRNPRPGEENGKGELTQWPLPAWVWSHPLPAVGCTRPLGPHLPIDGWSLPKGGWASLGSRLQSTCLAKSMREARQEP